MYFSIYKIPTNLGAKRPRVSDFINRIQTHQLLVLFGEETRRSRARQRRYRVRHRINGKAAVWFFYLFIYLLIFGRTYVIKRARGELFSPKNTAF